MELGYHVTLIKDATAAFNPEGMTAARVSAKLFAHAELNTDEMLATLSESKRLPAEEQTNSSLVSAHQSKN
jgi:nicotinamidase-related amidase